MSNKKTILEKLRIVERVEDNIDAPQVTDVDGAIKQEIKSTVLTSNNILDDTPIVDKPLGIKEIYLKSNQLSDGINTIFIIDNFSKALPENLPTSVKKQSVLNLISASGLNLQNVLRDGKEKLKLLSVFVHNFENKTDETIAKNEAEIKRLNEKIDQLKKNIENTEKLKQEQMAIVDYEIQRIQGIIDFIDESR